MIGDYPLYPQKEYRVVTTDYLFYKNTEYRLIQDVENIKIYPTGTVLRDIVEQFIKDNSPIDTRIEGRWIKK